MRQIKKLLTTEWTPDHFESLDALSQALQNHEVQLHLQTRQTVNCSNDIEGRLRGGDHAPLKLYSVRFPLLVQVYPFKIKALREKRLQVETFTVWNSTQMETVNKKNKTKSPVCEGSKRRH